MCKKLPFILNVELFYIIHVVLNLGPIEKIKWLFNLLKPTPKVREFLSQDKSIQIKV